MRARPLLLAAASLALVAPAAAQNVNYFRPVLEIEARLDTVPFQVIDVHGSRFHGDQTMRVAMTYADSVVLAAKLEAEAAALPEEEVADLLRAYGLPEPGLWTLIRAAYRLLDLVTFFSTASKEVRAWSVPRGTKAPQAAGRIHTDMERGFIRAEVIDWETLVAAGSLRAAHEQGRVRLEGKDYVVQDGDVVQFRFAM